MSDINDSYLAFSNAAWITLAANGSLSASSSMLIMFIIIRSSPEARYSAYHIIMFFMSLWDVISSTAMALGTIPMPSGVRETYPFMGMALGSIGSCEVQGFLIESAVIFILFSHTTLSLYYACTLKYEMTEDRFKKRIMPIILVLSLAFFMIPVTALRMDLINPSPLTGFCMITSYPFGCSNNYANGKEEQTTSSIECIRGGDSIFFSRQYYIIVYKILTVGVFTVMLISLVLVIISVFNAELSLRRSRRIQHVSTLLDSTTRAQAREQKIQDFEKTISITTQALMYIVAFLLSYASFFLENLQRATSWYFLLPPHGFLNAMIFIYHKASALRSTNSGLSLSGAFKQVILAPSTVPQQVISSIEIATEEIRVRRQEENRMHRGQSSLSLRERVMANDPGMRRFGRLIQTTDNNAASKPGSIDYDEDGDSFLRCLSSGISLKDLPSPGTATYDDLMRRFGTNVALTPDSNDSDKDGNSSSRCLSSGISLRGMFNPGIECGCMSMVDRREQGSVSTSGSAPLLNNEDLSYMSMGSTSMNL